MFVVEKSDRWQGEFVWVILRGMSDVSHILAKIEQGNARATEDWLPLVYDELRRLAAAKLAHEKPGQTLDATGLVHEAYLRLVKPAETDSWQNHRHFLAAAAEAMRRILIERSRQKAALKRGGNPQRQPLESLSIETDEDAEEMLALSDSLDRLAAADTQAAEIVKLRYFAGLTMQQTAETLSISERAAYYAWEYARSWLRQDLKSE
ncbi:MAG: sigma-70 family RNA polymerase sigma factor [Planctomyces sp.]|nr:sigma-70 family RNA polymerase sigma factor [Planctomyces sp.]